MIREAIKDFQQRYYVDRDDENSDDWYVFDSLIEPHKAISSWSSEEDAQTHANEMNASRMFVIYNKDEKRVASELVRYTRMSYIVQLKSGKLEKIPIRRAVRTVLAKDYVGEIV